MSTTGSSRRASPHSDLRLHKYTFRFYILYMPYVYIISKSAKVFLSGLGWILKNELSYWTMRFFGWTDLLTRIACSMRDEILSVVAPSTSVRVPMGIMHFFPRLTYAPPLWTKMLNSREHSCRRIMGHLLVEGDKGSNSSTILYHSFYNKSIGRNSPTFIPLNRYNHVM